MSMRASIGLITIMIAASPAVAADRQPWMKQHEMKAFSGIAAGYAAAYRCDRLVDADVAGAQLSKAFGGRAFSPIEVAEIISFSNGILAMQATVAGPITPEYCADVEKLFGPNGTAIKGFFD